MKRTLGLLIRLFLFAALILASVPVGATVTVCVLRTGAVVAKPVKCGMPCCRPEQTVVKTKPGCCLKHAPTAEKTIARTATVCGQASMSCRCETRLSIAASPVSVVRTSQALSSVDQPAILPNAVRPQPALRLVALEPGVVGVDSGPPRKRPRSPRQIRAPPVRLF